MKQYLDEIITVKPWILFVFAFIVSLINKTTFGILLLVIWCLLFAYWTKRVGEELFFRLENKWRIKTSGLPPPILWGLVTVGSAPMTSYHSD